MSHFGNITVSNAATFDGQIYMPTAASDPSSGTQGQLYYNTATDVLKAYNGTSWVAITASGGISTLDAAYDGGATITVDSGAVTLAHTHATNNALAITHAVAGSGDMINISSDSTGKLLNLSSTATAAAMSLTANSATTQIVATITANGLTTGSGLLVTSSGTITSAGQGLVNIVATGLTSGDALKIDLTEGTLNGGNYINCYDDTGAASVFKVAEDGAVTIAGVAGSNVFTITAGDAVMSDGSLAITDADNAASFSVTNSSTTSHSGIVAIVTSSTTGVAAKITVDSLTSGSGLLVTSSGTITSASEGLVNIVATGLTTGSALKIDLTEGTLTTGYYIECYDDTGAGSVFTVGEDGAVVIAGTASGTDAITVTVGDVTLTDGDLTLSSGDLAVTGNLTITGDLSITGDATYSATNISWSASATTGNDFAFAASSITGNGLVVTANGLTTGSGLVVTSSGTITSASEGLVNIVGSGMTSGSALKIDLTEGTLNGGYYLNCYDDTGAGIVFSIAENGATIIAGSASGTDALTLTAGDITLTSGDLTLTSGALVLTLGDITLTNGDLVLSSGDVIISDTTPQLSFKDTDATAGDVNASILVAATDTGNGSEDIDVTFSQQIAGTLTAFLTSDADGNITFGASRGVVATGGGSLTGTWSDLGTVTTVDINGGTVDGAVIGGSSAAAGTFTALTATGAIAFDGGSFTFNTSEADLDFRVASTGATNALFVQGSDGFVGMGIGAPTSNLHIFADASGEGMLIQSTGNTHVSIELESNRTGAGGALGEITSLWNGTEVTEITSVSGDDTGNKDDGHIDFYTASAGTLVRRMRISNIGNVGIGTTAPGLDVGTTSGDLTGAAFHVDGAASNGYLVAEGDIGGHLLLADSGGGSNDKLWDIEADGGVLTFRALNDDLTTLNDNVLVLDNSTGFVGISTATPSVELDVNGDLRVRHSGGASGAIIELSDRSSSNAMPISWNHYYSSGWKYRNTDFAAAINLDSAGDMNFLTLPSATAGDAVSFTGSVKLIIVNTGNVGMGTVTPGLNVGTTSGDLTGRAVHVDGTTSNGYLVAEGDLGGHLLLADSGGGSNDKLMNLEMDGGVLVFRALNDNLTTLSDNILALDHGAGFVCIGTATGTAALTMGDDKLIARDVNAGITASTTQTQGNGALTAEVNEVSTVANANDTVTLPTAVAGLRIVIINNGANTLKIFPASGANLGAGTDTATTLSSGSNVVYQSYNTTNWEAI